MTNKDKIEAIKEERKTELIHESKRDELLIIIAEELIKMNEYLEKDSIKF